ncbi:MAG: hypothetical protein CL920_11775 [Deltaproteobacteria bacterium]|nr:hypothetical protein [Deltaproteobacteria bacterium]|tara:strand:- start:33071 stop:34261 length:1191 start_codon:yes stop_codon:yes gene_type:complete
MKKLSYIVACCAIPLYIVACSPTSKGNEQTTQEPHTHAEQTHTEQTQEPTVSTEASSEPTTSPTEKAQEPIVQNEPSPEPTTTPDAGTETLPEQVAEAQPESVQEATPEAAPETGRKDRVITGGDVSGSWCGNIEVQAAITIPAGKTLTLCAGTKVTLADGVTVSVKGSLLANGTKAMPITMKPSQTMWRGLRVDGKVVATFLELHKGSLCLDGRATSDLTFTQSLINECSIAARFMNGGTFIKTKFIGEGNSIHLTGGTWTMTDSVIDLKKPRIGPDCTKLRGGNAMFTRVHFTGCHCPLHFAKSDKDIRVVDSIFDGASYPMMIANTKGVFLRNHFIGGRAHIQDIGDGKSVSVSINNNYFDGKAPTLDTQNKAQFTGRGKYATTPFANVGPRP